MTLNPYINAAKKKQPAKAKLHFDAIKEKLNDFDLLIKVKELFQALKEDDYIDEYSIQSTRQTERFSFMGSNGHVLTIILGVGKGNNPTIEYKDSIPRQKINIEDRKKVRNKEMSQEEYDEKYPIPDVDVKIHKYVLAMRNETSFTNKEYRTGAGGGPKIDIESDNDRDLALQDVAWFVMNLPNSIRPTQHLEKASSRVMTRHL